MERLLITGIGGGQARLLARRLAGRWSLSGIDRAPMPGIPKEVTFYPADLRSRRVEDVFRRERPTAVVHLGLVRHSFDERLRHDVNVVGTKNLLEYCARYEVQKVVVLTSSYVYGALPENPFYMDEDTALNVSRHYPEIRDLAEVDNLTTTFLWRYPEISTAILRPVNTLGATIQSSIGSYLRLRWIPTVMGFDPMVQFIHEDDLASAMEHALEKGARGVFNVTGAGAVPLSVAIEETGGTALPLPDTLARGALDRLFRFGMFPVPGDAIDFVKFACTIDGRRFRSETGFQPRVDLPTTLASLGAAQEGHAS